MIFMSPLLLGKILNEIMKSQQTTTNKSSISMNQYSSAEASSEKRVNINNLISRYKKEKAKERKETIIFVGLACALILVSGIIISL